MRVEELRGFIDFPSGFKLLGPVPIDCRVLGEDLAFLDSIIEIGAAYPGLRVYIKSTKKFYNFSLTEDNQYVYEEESSQPILTTEQQAALDSGITSSKLSELESKYLKPVTGIPEADLASDLKTKLNKTTISNVSPGTNLGDISVTDSLGVLRTFKVPGIEELTTEEEVIQLISSRASRQISGNTSGGGFNSLANLTSGPWYYGGQVIPQLIEGDRAIILASGSDPAKTMAYTGNNVWVLVSEGNYSFSDKERKALTSGITEAKAGQIEINRQNIEFEITRAISKETELSQKIGDDFETHNNSNSSHLDIREGLSTINTSLEGVASSVNQLSGIPDRLSTLEINITNLSSRVETNSSSINSDEGRLTALEGRATSLENGKQIKINGSNNQETILLSPSGNGEQPRTITMTNLVSGTGLFSNPVSTKIKEIENKNSQQDDAIVTVQQAVEVAQSTANSKVESIAEGTTDGTINVDGTDVPVKGLKSLAYKDSLTKAEVGLSNVTNDQQATKAEFNALKTKVERLEALGSFVGSYNTYNDLPDNISLIQAKYGVDATVNDFATVRSGGESGYPAEALPEYPIIGDDDPTCWSIISIGDQGKITWAFEYLMDKDITGKIDKVVNSTEGRIAILTSEGGIGQYSKTASEIDTAISQAQSTANTAISTLAEKVDKVDGKGLSTNDYDDDAKTAVSKIADSVKTISKGTGLGKIKYTTNGGTPVEVNLSLGNMAEKTLNSGEGIVKQSSSGKLEIYSPYYCYVGEGGVLNGFNGLSGFSWGNRENEMFTLTVSPSDYGSNRGKYGDYYFPRVRLFKVVSNTLVKEISGLVTINHSSGNITISSYHNNLRLFVIIE